MLIRAEYLAVFGAFLLAIPLLWETWHLGVGRELLFLFGNPLFGGRL
jgi:hypothetical protein